MKTINSFLSKLDVKSLVKDFVWVNIVLSIINFAYYLWLGDTTNLVNTFSCLVMTIFFYAISIHLNKTKSYDITINENGQEINFQINDNIEEINIKYDENNKPYVEYTYKK